MHDHRLCQSEGDAEVLACPDKLVDGYLDLTAGEALSAGRVVLIKPGCGSASAWVHTSVIYRARQPCSGTHREYNDEPSLNDRRALERLLAPHLLVPRSVARHDDCRSASPAAAMQALVSLHRLPTQRNKGRKSQPTLQT